jgi:hypothetical protein
MKIASDNYVMTDSGFRTVFQLLQIQNESKQLPKVLTFDLLKSSGNLYYETIGSIKTYNNVDIYESFFMDIPNSRISTVYLSNETSILQYDIRPTNIEPLIQRSLNVFGYLLNNKSIITTQWTPLRELNNFGTLTPNVSFSDIVTKFLEKKILIRDDVFSIVKQDTEGVDDQGNPIIIPGVEIPVFTSRHPLNVNFILVK